MSIRLRLSFIYTAILAVTLVIFGIALYTVQARYTIDALKQDLSRSGNNLAQSILWMQTHSPQFDTGVQQQPPPPRPLEQLSGNQAFQELREREIVRVIDTSGTLIASPFSGARSALPISTEGFTFLMGDRIWWEIAYSNDERLLIYNRPVTADGEVIFIVQVARSLTERDRSLDALARTLMIAGFISIVAAFGIGFMIAGTSLRPIHRITQTAQEIGKESDFTHRVDYHGANDEVGELATTFNQMLARLQDAYDKVSRSLKMQQDFVADVSHELRTPLTTVRGNLDLLRRDPPIPPEEQSDVLTDMVDESDRLIRLVNDLLILARADAGRNLLQEPVELQPLVNETCRLGRQLDPEREILEMSQELTVLADRDALKQVLLILLDNALKHTQGTITIATEKVNGEICISVSDNGPGIPEDVLPYVFDRFIRGDTEKAVPGFGLGLPIAKALTKGQGGRISIESEIGKGSSVKVSFPQL